MMAGAELANVLNEGALEAVRRGADEITRSDIYNGIDRVLQVLLLPAPTQHDPAPLWWLCCALTCCSCIFSFACLAWVHVLILACKSACLGTLRHVVPGFAERGSAGVVLMLISCHMAPLCGASQHIGGWPTVQRAGSRTQYRVIALDVCHKCLACLQRAVHQRWQVLLGCVDAMYELASVWVLERDWAISQWRHKLLA